ncbi:hypothetical protein Tco_0802103 [Tanacetum coccineum]|uniref:CCHC-type domain-containing protein n=1 Tax=Tanacetum coccineum TaxID=301880 RepID=A0ABQ4ZYR7_9ASTR
MLAILGTLIGQGRRQRIDGGLVDKIVRNPNKTLDSSQQPPQNCARCGNPVDGLYYRGCALLRKKFKEDLFTYCVESEIFQDLQDTSESSNDNTNVVNAPQEPLVVKQDLDENSSQSPPHIDHHCCYECGDSLDDIFCQRCTCKSCGKGAHHGYNCPPKVPIISNPGTCNIQSFEELHKHCQASPPDSEIVSLEEVKDFHTEDGEIKDDILREKLSKINLLIAKIEAINSNPPPSSDFCKCTTRSDYSLSDYESFYDHIKEISSGNTTTHADFSQYDSFHFDILIDPLPLADRSDSHLEEFVDELAHIISPLEYDCFYFKSEPDPRYLTSIIDPGIRENVSSTTNVNLPFQIDQSPLFAYVVWIFLSFLTYPVAPPYLLSFGNEDTIFDLGISIYHSFMPGVSHRSGTFMKFNDFPDVEVSRAHGFCPSFTRASHPQLHYGNPIS